MIKLKALILILIMSNTITLLSQKPSLRDSIEKEILKIVAKDYQKLNEVDTGNAKLIKDVSSKTNNAIKSIFQNQIKCHRETLDFQRWAMVFSPTLIILIFALLLYRNLNNKNNAFTITDLISVNRDNETKVLSVSRFIVLLTGLAAIFIGTTMTMYYGYLLVAECNFNPSTDSLWKILAGLGIGVVPYGVNVWNGNEKERTNANG